VRSRIQDGCGQWLLPLEKECIMGYEKQREPSIAGFYLKHDIPGGKRFHG
jgi:hypothetical protein